MAGFVRVEIRSEEVVEAMVEDPNFAAEVWNELAGGLEAGALLDDLVDYLKAQEKPVAQWMVGVFDRTLQVIKSGDE